MTPADPPNPVAVAVAAAEAELAHVDPADPAQALPRLRAAQERLGSAIDEAMAAVVLAQGSTLRSAGRLAGLSENAVGPRLARTSLLAAYGSEAGRVTASGVERARYDLEQERHRGPDDETTAPPKPLRFRARRST